MAAGLAGLWISADLDGEKAKGLRFAPWLFAGGFVIFAGLVTYAGWVSDMNDERCFNIQRELLLPEPRRSDLPDVFTALSCRPQGKDDIQFPKKPTQPPRSDARRPPAHAK